MKLLQKSYESVLDLWFFDKEYNDSLDGLRSYDKEYNASLDG